MLKSSFMALLLCLLLGIIFGLPFVPLESNRTVEAPFLERSGSDKAVVFFGFSHCGGVCPTTLLILKSLLDNTTRQSQWPQVVFVDIDENSSTQQAQAHARSYHNAFSGVHAKAESLAQLSRDFGLNIQQDGEQIKHQGRTYLLARSQQQWRIVKAYNPETFDFKTLQDELY
ncbi:SCO family protein [Pseudoalteromonas rubra]|uniref:SCO family protein n=1 Tax=Pseudoalteromonas rubra TaxID=43658 RepID=UPI000F776665|nr:SCO family protein [Pseudoalteromonas rubra]